MAVAINTILTKRTSGMSDGNVESLGQFSLFFTWPFWTVLPYSASSYWTYIYISRNKVSGIMSSRCMTPLWPIIKIINTVNQVSNINLKENKFFIPAGTIMESIHK